MPTLAPPAPRRRPARRPLTELHRLLRKRDHLADQLTARHCHGLPANDLWIALVQLEDCIRDDYPRAYTTHLPQWLQRQAPGAHRVGAHNSACPLCNPHTTHTTTTGQTR